MSKFCGYCGVEMQENTKFCPNCGKEMGMNIGNESNSQPEQQYVPQETTPSDSIVYQQKKSNKAIVVIVSILIIVVLALVITVAYLLGKMNGAEDARFDDYYYEKYSSNEDTEEASDNGFEDEHTEAREVVTSEKQQDEVAEQPSSNEVEMKATSESAGESDYFSEDNTSNTLVNSDIKRFAQDSANKCFNLKVGERVQPTAAIWKGPVDISDTSVITVDDQGILTAKGAGIAIVTYHGLTSMKETYKVIVEE